MTDEILYSFRLEGSVMRIRKWDGHKAPTDWYSITNKGKGSCDCFGALRGQGMCKHRQMMERLFKLGLNLMGCFYDYDHDILYTPEDGEGVPLSGAVDIWGLSITQGKAY